jgi:hypothetical protein
LSVPIIHAGNYNGCIGFKGEKMKSAFSRLFGILLMVSFVLAACAPQAAQTAAVNVQPPETSTPLVVDEATALATEDIAPTPQPTLNVALRVASAMEAEAALTSGVSFLEDLSNEKYDPAAFSKPGIVTYTVPLPESEPLLWTYAWCSANTEMLAANFKNIQLKFVLDNKEVSADSFATYETETGEKVCRLVYTSLSNWSVGEHHLVTTATFTAKINDGTAEYDPGDYVLDYVVSLKP